MTGTIICIVVLAGLALLWLGYKKFKADNQPTTTTINIDTPTPQEEQPVPLPDDVMPSEQPNAVVDRKEAEREVTADIVANQTPLSASSYIESPMVTPVDDPSSSPVEEDNDDGVTGPWSDTPEPVVGDDEDPDVDEEDQLTDIADLDPSPAIPASEPFGGKRFTGDLTDEEVRAIRASDKTNAELGLQYDKSARTIARIRKRQSYTHVA